ncbi:MAG: hypothetical protein IT289_09225 [Oligoflexia bacterium]|nr:hypothetical protein [Oligoflexia bacterium]
MNKFTRLAVVVCVCLYSTLSFGWGRVGHEVALVLATQHLPPGPLKNFLQQNIPSIRIMAMVPDVHWKHGEKPNPLENHLHFFNWDFFSKVGPVTINFQELRARVGDEAILKNGSAPYRVNQMSYLLLTELKRVPIDPVRVLQIAGTLGHYIADVGNPLHVNTDYNGQNSGVKGLHSFFESKSVNEIPPMELHDRTSQLTIEFLKKIPANIHPFDGSMKTIQGAHLFSPKVIEAAQELGLTQEFSMWARPVIYRTLAVSTALAARIWYAAWSMAGKPDLPPTPIGPIPNPDWIPPSYFQSP